jgi:Fis family transcriptional regulator
VRLTATRNKAGARDKSGSTATGKAANGSHAAGRTPGGGPATISRSLPLRAATPPGAARSPGESLEQSVFRSLEQYFANLDGAKPHALHEMVLGAIEKPLLQFALHRCDGNQSAAADLLGINRNTLRRKLQDYGLH